MNREKKDSNVYKKISQSLVLFNKSELGKDVKKISHEKRSKTMEQTRMKIRSELTHKKCGMCKVTKQSSDFHKKSSSRDGLQPYCLDCEM